MAIPSTGFTVHHSKKKKNAIFLISRAHYSLRSNDVLSDKKVSTMYNAADYSLLLAIVCRHWLSVACCKATCSAPTIRFICFLQDLNKYYIFIYMSYCLQTYTNEKH